MANKSTVDEIKARFDNDVDRFSNLETGQTATIDAPICLELIAKAAHVATPNAKRLLDVGCGAGNFALRLLSEGTYSQVTLVDLSRPMLDRAASRVQSACAVHCETIQADIRDLELKPNSFDVVVAGAVLHHLRTPQQWKETFAKLHEALAPGGSLWIFDLVTSSIAPIARLQDQRYGDYLAELKDEVYRDHVFEYIAKEDSPVPVDFQLELLKKVGFKAVDILHFNTRFAAFGGVK